MLDTLSIRTSLTINTAFDAVNEYRLRRSAFNAGRLAAGQYKDPVTGREATVVQFREGTHLEFTKPERSGHVWKSFIDMGSGDMGGLLPMVTATQEEFDGEECLGARSYSTLEHGAENDLPLHNIGGTIRAAAKLCVEKNAVTVPGQQNI